MKELAPVTVSIHGLSHEGRGITTIDGKTTFVRGALPDEQVSISITKKHSRYFDAQINEIFAPSHQRVVPKCQHTSICGGCSMQHLDSMAQIQYKQKTLLEQLKHFGGVIPEEILPPLTADPWGYRHKARLGVRYVIKKEKLLVGFREHNNRYLADLSSCEVLVPEVGHHLTDFATLISSLSKPHCIAQIEVASGDQEHALVLRNLEALTPEDEEKLIEFGKNNHYTLYLQEKKPYALKKLWPNDDHHRLQYSFPEFQLTFAFHPLDFIQINPAMNIKMVKQAIELLALEPHEHVLDLFCGLGNFSLPMAKLAAHVTGIEGSEEMVSRANENARLNNVTNTSFYMANLAEKLSSQPWSGQNYAKILLDPPRSGAEEMIPMLVGFQAAKIVYVSCNPATLARDAGLLTTQGYRLSKAGVMDMFPHTSHVESIALFERM